LLFVLMGQKYKNELKSNCVFLYFVVGKLMTAPKPIDFCHANQRHLADAWWDGVDRIASSRLGLRNFFNFFQNIACDIKIKSYFCIVNDISNTQ